MTLGLKQLIFIALFFIGFSTTYAQLNFSNELGIIVGPVAFQSDFGERRDFETNSGNTGIGIGIVHFMNFEYTSGYSKYSYFKDHFKVRSEISWNKTSLKHFGKWVAPEKTGVNADKLRAHSGEANNLDLGMQLEFFPFSIKEFSLPHSSFTPFFGLGVHFTAFNSKVFTNYGDGNPNNLNNFYSPWHLNKDGSVKDEDFIFNGKGTAVSIVGSVGGRYKLSYYSDLLVDLRWQQYFNDKVDGLDHTLPSNKSNDHLVWLNFGYVHYFD